MASDQQVRTFWAHSDSCAGQANDRVAQHDVLNSFLRSLLARHHLDLAHLEHSETKVNSTET